MPAEFKVGDVVCLGHHGEKGKIIDIYRPLGTYPMYKVHMMTNGSVKSAAHHELVKGLPDEDFQDLYDAFQVPRPTPTSTLCPLEILDNSNESSQNSVEYEIPAGPLSICIFFFCSFLNQH